MYVHLMYTEHMQGKNVGLRSSINMATNNNNNNDRLTAFDPGQPG